MFMFRISQWPKEDTLKFGKGQGQVSLANIFFNANRHWEGLVYSVWQIDLTVSCELLFAVRSHYLRDSSPFCNSANAWRGTTLSTRESDFVFHLDCFFLVFEHPVFLPLNNYKDRKAEWRTHVLNVCRRHINVCSDIMQSKLSLHCLLLCLFVVILCRFKTFCVCLRSFSISLW